MRLDWQLVTDVSGRPIGPISTFTATLPLKKEPQDRSETSVNNNQVTPRDIPEEERLLDRKYCDVLKYFQQLPVQRTIFIITFYCLAKYFSELYTNFGYASLDFTSNAKSNPHILPFLDRFFRQFTFIFVTVLDVKNNVQCDVTP